MKNAFLVLALSLLSLTTFASDVICIGKLDGEPAKISITEKTGDIVKVTVKLNESHTGTGIIIDRKDGGYAVTAIIGAKDEEAFLLKINISEDFSTSYATLTIGSDVTRSKLVCAKN
jgi:hypothetical protein